MVYGCMRFFLIVTLFLPLTTLRIKVAALRGYENVNGLALDLWEEVYPKDPLIALTDTFSTDVFYKVKLFLYKLLIICSLHTL